MKFGVPLKYISNLTKDEIELEALVDALKTHFNVKGKECVRSMSLARK